MLMTLNLNPRHLHCRADILQQVIHGVYTDHDKVFTIVLKIQGWTLYDWVK